MKKIVHVIWNLNPGGAQTYLAQSLNQFSRQSMMVFYVIVLSELG